MNTRDKIHSAINEHIDIEDTYAYFLTREKSSFSVGTVTLDDFEEWTDSDVADLTDLIMEKINPELNENQQVVLEWLKGYALDDSDFKNAICELSKLYIAGVPYKKEEIAFKKLNDRELAQVLAAFTEWGLSNA
jgi:hypothetical protein